MLVVLTGRGLSMAAVVPTAMPPKSAYGVWTQPAAAGLDAVSTWVVPGNLPTAAAGQLPPSYLYAHYFNFTQAPSALGVIGLVTSAGSRLVAFGIVDEAGTSRSVGLPYDWVEGRAYYLLEAQLSATSFGAWVYDHSLETLTVVGQVTLPVAPGKIAPTTLTTAIWFGPAGDTCSAYPRADAYFSAPVGHSGGQARNATLATTATSATGICPATATTEVVPWLHLHLGADPAA